MTKLMPVFASLAFLLAAQSCGQDGGRVREAWNAVNDPLRLQGGYQRKLGSLPKQGSLATKPWSDTYWPSRSGGIAARWFDSSSSADAFNYRLYSKEEVKSLSEDQRKRLSPAEKFDIARGLYDYPTVKAERARTSPNAEAWEGLCHGWAPAAMLFSEPQAIVFQGADGVRIPFGSSDVKALLTLYQGNIANLPAKVLGSRCNQDLSLNPADRFRSECKDTNAGAFHVVLTNQIGVQGASFLADVTTDREVWNQPVHSYQTQIVEYQAPTAGAAPGTVKEAVVQTTMGYTVETAPSYSPLNNTSGHADAQKVYRYRLELNGNDEILGGEWISDERPDFLWLQDRAQFGGEWETLGRIYTQSTNGVTPNPTPRPTTGPTPRPTTGPTPRPTTGPTPRPTTGPSPAPTAGPTPVPTAGPTDPVDPINPNPPPTPVQQWEQVQGQDVICPPDMQILNHKITQVKACAKGSQSQDQVPGDLITQVMVDQCYNQGLGTCDRGQWNLGQYAQIRGNSDCSPGALEDKETGYCREGNDLIGPFKIQVVQACEEYYQRSQQSSNICQSVRLKKDFVNLSLGIGKGGKGGWKK